MTFNISSLLIFIFAVGFFIPSFSLGEKRVFFIDLLFLMSPALVLFQKQYKKLEWTKILGVTVLFTVIYLHGVTRTPLNESLPSVQFNSFSYLQDGILFSRFLSWIWFGFFVSSWSKIEKEENTRFSRFLSGFSILCVLESILAFFFYFGPLKAPAGAVYGYNPSYFDWSDRLYGTLSSPPELGAALGIGVLFWCHKIFIEKSKDPKHKIFLALCGFAFLGANSFSCILGLFVSLIYLNQKYILKYKRIILPPMILILGILAFFLFNSHRIIEIFPELDKLRLTNKVNNFKFRLVPWKMYLDTLFTRFDYLIFGVGFARTHSDNSYIHILRTGGLTLFLPLMGLIFRAFLASERFLRAILIYFLISALALDIFIFRIAGPVFLILCFLSRAGTHTKSGKKL